MPDEPEASGLLALMLFQDARRATRVDDAGDLVLLTDQDRSRWDRSEIEEGTRILDAALRRGRPGPHQVQAAIAACHATAADPADADWAEIAALYGELARLMPFPGRGAEPRGRGGHGRRPAAGLELVTALDASGALRDYHLLPATRADLLLRLGRRAEAAASNAEALELAGTDSERRFLTRRLAEAAAPG